MTTIYEEKDELGHTPDGDPWWQESVVVTFWDDAAGLGLLFRIGHEVGQGTSTVWMGAVTADGQRYRCYRGALPLTDADRSGDWLSGSEGGQPMLTSLLDGGVLRWRARRPEFEADLAVTDFYPMTNPLVLHTESSLSREFAAQHWEASGRVRGTVRLGDRRYDVDALHHRDHSWGVRRWNTIRSHRWVAGTTGRELSFMAMSWLANDGTLSSHGFVNRDGETTLASAVDIVAYVDIDGMSSRGGKVHMDLADGTSVGFEAAPVDGIMTLHRNVACVDTLSRVRTDSGRVGFCDFETTHNSRDGSAPVEVMVGAVMDDGLSHR